MHVTAGSIQGPGAWLVWLFVGFYLAVGVQTWLQVGAWPHKSKVLNQRGLLY